MRARLAIYYSGLSVQIREVVLRDKPPSMLEASPKGTVPVLITSAGKVVDESLDIMLLLLGQSDPKALLGHDSKIHEQMMALISECDGPFKAALDRYKYPNRYTDVDPIEQRKSASAFLVKLDLSLIHI